MIYILSLPLIFLRFWFLEVPIALISFFGSLNNAISQLLSIKEFLYTFFNPVKNEYRKGLVLFSIVMGMIIKSILLVFDATVLITLLIAETAVVLSFILLPFATIAILFINV